MSHFIFSLQGPFVHNQSINNFSHTNLFYTDGYGRWTVTEGCKIVTRYRERIWVRKYKSKGTTEINIPIVCGVRIVYVLYSKTEVRSTYEGKQKK